MRSPEPLPPWTSDIVKHFVRAREVWYLCRSREDQIQLRRSGAAAEALLT